MFFKKKPDQEPTCESQQLEKPEQSKDVSPQDELVWVHLQCSDRIGYMTCGVRFAALLPRWRADEFIRHEATPKCPSCDSYGAKILTTKEELGICSVKTHIGETRVRCDRLRGHRGNHECTWDTPGKAVEKASYIWWVEESEKGEAL